MAADPNYRLQPNSPAMDKGVLVVGINDGFDGRAPDIGAYELVSHPAGVNPEGTTNIKTSSEWVHTWGHAPGAP